MSERSAQPRKLQVKSLNTISTMIKKLTNAIAGYGMASHWPVPDD